MSNLSIEELLENYQPKHTGCNTLSIDGTGRQTSVDTIVSPGLKSYILEQWPQARKFIDVGSGQGYLQKEFEKTEGITMMSVEGSKNVPFVANPKHRLQEDFCTDLPEIFTDYFDVLTSFECIEHIHPTEQDKFWSNVKKVTNKALVGIHVKNQTDHDHCFIKGEEYWSSYFSQIGMTWTLLSTELPPETLNTGVFDGTNGYHWEDYPQATCSLFYKLEWTK